MKLVEVDSFFLREILIKNIVNFSIFYLKINLLIFLSKLWQTKILEDY